MDLKQLEYIVKIAEENNITKAAEKLFITQSALNQQLLKLEKELGTELFYRSRTSFRPTPAGELYLHAAGKMLSLKKDTYRQINDISDIKKGTLSIGFTKNRGTGIFSCVYPIFHRNNPGILIEPMELSVKEQLAMLSAGSLDIGFMTLPKRYEAFNSHTYTQIKTEEIFLAIPRRHPLSALATSSKKPFPVLDLYQLREEPFVLMHQKSTFRSMADGIFKEAGFLPHVLFETSSTHTILTMIESEICCGLIPEYYVDTLNEKITYFSLGSHPTWDLLACRKKGRYESKASKDFIHLAKEYLN